MVQSSKIFERKTHDDKNTSRPSTLKMDVKTAEVQKLILET